MKVVKVLQKGQIVIPKALREQVGIQVGRKVIVDSVDSSVLVMPEPKDPIRLMKGLLKETKAKPSVETVRQLRKEWDERTK